MAVNISIIKAVSTIREYTILPDSNPEYKQLKH